MNPDQMDRLYLNEDFLSGILVSYNDAEYDANRRAEARQNVIFSFCTHETMHLVQYGSGAFNLMKGMRPNICAAVDMLTEFLAWFYTGPRYPDTYITADMANAVETQSKYMILAVDPDEYDAARAKDPSLPPFVHSAPWFHNEIGNYVRQAFTNSIVRKNAFTDPLRQAKKICLRWRALCLPAAIRRWRA